VSIAGLPNHFSGQFDIELSGCGHVSHGDGTMLQTAVITTPPRVTGSAPPTNEGHHTSASTTTVVCLGSYDGLAWHYRGTVATLAGTVSSASHDIATLNWGMLYAALSGDDAAGWLSASRHAHTHTHTHTHTHSHTHARTHTHTHTHNSPHAANHSLPQCPSTAGLRGTLCLRASAMEAPLRASIDRGSPCWETGKSPVHHDTHPGVVL
jgi:hypothetical protein